MQNEALLRGVYLFAELSAEDLGQLTKIAEPKNLPAGYLIFRAGDPATALYLVKNGTVRISVDTPGGDPVEVATLGTGSHFGEMALVDDMKRSATAETLEPTAVLCFEYEKVRDMLAKSPATASKVYRAFARFLSNRLRQTTTDISFARGKNFRHF